MLFLLNREAAFPCSLLDFSEICSRYTAARERNLYRNDLRLSQVVIWRTYVTYLFLLPWLLSSTETLQKSESVDKTEPVHQYSSYCSVLVQATNVAELPKPVPYEFRHLRFGDSSFRPLQTLSRHQKFTACKHDCCPSQTFLAFLSNMFAIAF